MNDQTGIKTKLSIWFIAIRAGSGADVFTDRLVTALKRRGIRAEITWLPHRAEYAPWSVPKPVPPAGVDIVHINSWLHRRFIPPNIPVVATIHSCIHDPALIPYKSFLKRLYHKIWIKRCEKHTLKTAIRVTAVSHHTAKQATEIFGRSDIATIYNWADIEHFPPATHIKPNNPFRMLYVGKMNRLKGTDLFPLILDKLGNNFEIHFTGKKNDFTNCPPNLIPLGRLHDVDSLVKAYQQSDVLLFPTRLEGLPLTVLEAMSCGRPVITSNCCSLPEIVETGITGILCPVDDIDAFVAAARQLRRDSREWREMCISARERVLTHFSESVAIDAYIRLYNDIHTAP